MRALVDCIEEREKSLMASFDINTEHCNSASPRKDLRAIIERLRAPSPIFIGIRISGQDELLLRVVLEALEEGDSHTMLPLEDCREFVEGAQSGITNKLQEDTWRQVLDFHVTCLYMGGARTS